TTNGSGVASVSGVSLGTIAANTYPTGVGASFAAVTGCAASAGSNSLTVNKAPLTVTADNKSREYGDANPSFTASFSGFKNGETLATSGVTGSPSLSTTATAARPVASYPITAAVGTRAEAKS